MEQPLIVLIDPESRKVYLYGEYTREFMLEEMHILTAFLKDKTVMYVTQATEVNADELIETANAINEQLEPIEPVKRFFRVNAEGFTHIPELKIRFSGPKDCKDVGGFSKNVFDKSPTMTKLLKSGKLEILTEEEVAKLKKPKPRTAESQSILMNTKIRDIDGTVVFEPESIFTDDNEVPADPNAVIETDEEEAIRKGFGRKE